MGAGTRSRFLAATQDRPTPGGTVVAVLAAVSFGHFLNDLMQALLPAVYPILKPHFDLDFSQIGLLTLTFQLTASLLQPLVGLYTDATPLPYSLPLGMGSTLLGLLLLSIAPSFACLLAAAALIGVGSSVFHPEASRVARLASGGRHGFAQSVFQVGGSGGAAIGPLAAAFVILPRGQSSIAWFGGIALLGMALLAWVGAWYRQRLRAPNPPGRPAERLAAMPRRRVASAMGVLVVLVFSKHFYLASITTFLTFYLLQKFQLSVASAQLHLFLFLVAVAIGTLIGGPIGDRIGRRYVIWFSILGAFPFTAMLPYANLMWTGVLTVVIGLILSSAFSAIVVLAQELVPGRVGAISGLFFGLAFGMGGLGAAVLGALADRTSVSFVYQICAFLPLIGLLAVFLPDPERASLQAR